MFVQAAPSNELLDGLNEEQHAAVTHEQGPLLVLAGAGTGKTTTLVTRLAWLVSTGVAPERILLLTFTRRAARQMLARARTLIASDEPRQIVGGTFHSVAYRLIATHCASLGLPPRIGILDASDAADLLDLLREEHGLAVTGRRFPRKDTVAAIYSRCVNAQRALSEVLADHFPWCEDHVDALGCLFRAYEQRKHELGRLDLDDLLLYWQALARHELIGPKIAAAYEHVLVDEYQDLNRLQVEILRELRREQRNLTGVGDDAQAIYSFRAASAAHILGFNDDFPDATMVTLTRNYRSTQPILDLANEVWADAPHSYPKRLRAARGGAVLPQLVYCLDSGGQATEVCMRVLALYEEGVALRDQAVLMRAGRHSNELELELGRRKIPFVKYGGIGYLEAAHVKDFICALRITENAADQLAWFRVLRLLPGVGPVTARRALDALDPTRLDDTSELRARWQANVEPLLKAPTRRSCTPLIEAIAQERNEPSVGTLVDRIRSAVRPLIQSHYADGLARLPDLDVLTEAASEASTLASFLADLALDPPASTADYAKNPHLDDDYLTLSTVHSAKGLEWDAVHIISASDGNFPSDMALTSPGELEEERRLFYVALTRPCRTLTIYVPVRYYHTPSGHDDTHGYAKQSRFLTAPIEALCERINAHSTDTNVPGTSEPVAAGPVTVQIDLEHLWR
jgi:DNA helicase-2/ATP-dependent DNA helicase PcrA